MVVIRLTPVPTASATKLPFGRQCDSPDSYWAQVVPVANGARECWGVVGPVLLSQWKNPKNDPIYLRALDGLHEGGIGTPPFFISATWYHVDSNSWAAIQYFFDPRSDPAAPGQPSAWTRSEVLSNTAATQIIDRVADWARRITPFLQDGMAGTPAPDATSVLFPHDPA